MGWRDAPLDEARDTPSTPSWRNAPIDDNETDRRPRSTLRERRVVAQPQGNAADAAPAARAPGRQAAPAAPIQRDNAPSRIDMGSTGVALGLTPEAATRANETAARAEAVVNPPAPMLPANGYLGRQAVKAEQALAGIGSGLARSGAAMISSPALSSAFAPVSPFIGMLRGGAGQALGEVINQHADNADRYIGAPVAGDTSWEDVKSAGGLGAKLGAAGRFVLEQGPSSLLYLPLYASPEGVALYGTSLTGNIAQDRARANNRDRVDATDVALAAPAAAISTALDKYGFENLIGEHGGNVAIRVAKAALGEGLTEAVQNPIEYAGSSLGTRAGFDPEQAIDQALSGGLVGFAAGGAFRGAAEAIDSSGRLVGRRQDDTRTPPVGAREAAVIDAATISPEDHASPLETSDIVAGRMDIANATGSKVANDALTASGLPTVGTRVTVGNLPGGKSMAGTIEDHFADESGAGVVIRPDGGGKPLREYLDTLNELGVTIAPASPTAEADAIDAGLAADASLPAQGAGVPSPSPVPVRQAAPSRDPAHSTARGGAVNQSIVDGLRKRGLSEGQAMGIAAGIHAESASNPNAQNPSSGAFGLGQWLGARAAEIRRRFGDKPTFDQQLDYLVWELRGGDHGGKAVLAESDPARVLDAYVRKFMRPAAGGETDGDIARGMSALGQPVDTASRPGLQVEPTKWSDIPADERVSTPISEVQAPTVQRRDIPGSDMAGQPIDKEWTRFAETSGTLGIPRAEMPQIKAEHRGAMVNFLNARDISHQEETVPASSLRPSQAEFSPEKVQKAKDYEGGNRAILISSDNHVLDGHHQWLGARDNGEDVRAIRLNAPIRDLIQAAHEFPSSETADGATPATAANQSAASPAVARVEETATGKSVAVIGASQAERAAIDAAVPQARFMVRKDGALIYSKKYADKIAAAITGASKVAAATAVPQAAQSGEQAKIDADFAANRAVMRNFTSRQEVEWEHSNFYRDGTARTFSGTVDKVSSKDQGIIRVVSPSGADYYVPARLLRQKEKGPKAEAPKPKEEHPGLVVHNLRTGKETVIKPRDTVPVGQPVPQRETDKKNPNPYVRTGEKVRFLEQVEYLGGNPDDTYTVTSASKTEAFFTNDASGGRSSLKNYQIAAAIRTGKMAMVQAEKPSASATPEATAQAAPSKNRLVTDERAAELRERLKAKLNPNRLNSGLDPEILAIGAELAVYHIEKGARRFSAFARAIANDLDTPLASIRQYLRGWYNGARDMMEDMGESVAGMDDAGEVGKSMRTFDQWANTAPMTGGEDGATGSANVELPNRVPASDAGTGPSDVQRTAPVGRDGRAPQQEGGRSPGDVPGTDRGQADPAERGTGEPAGRAAGDGTGVRDADNLPAAEQRTGSRSSATRRAADSVKGEDWSITPGSLSEERPLQQKARDNIDAIALVKKIIAEDRPATRAEQETIARYVGWGGIKNVFADVDGTYGKGFEELGPRLRELLSDEEYETARRSIQYAHYTSEHVVRPMWEIARQLGFTGGVVFEPGMGTGNFRGMMPADIAAASSYSGLEYDHLTANIARLLYPQSGVQQGDYTRVPGIKGAVDLVIGNPPFSETTISADPDYAKHKFVLHDFFFAKSLDALKPGGLLMFVTSAGTMNKLNTKAREYLADRADLVGAIRLPGNAFEQNAGTSVTTDIVILRKRGPGEKPGDQAWVNTDTLTLPDRDGNMVDGQVNRYFIEHPDMVLGEQGMFDKLIAGPRYAVRAPKGFDVEQAIRDAATKLPGAITSTTPSLTPVGASDIDMASNEKKDGSYYFDADGRLMQFRNGVGTPVRAPGKGVTGGMSAAAQQRVRGLIPIKDALREVFSADLKADTIAGGKAREKLNKAYDAFVSKFGPVNKTDISYRAPNSVQLESARAAAREEARLAGREWDDGSFDIQPYLDRGATLAEIARDRKAARQAAIAAGRRWNEGSFEPSDVPDTVVEKRPNLDPFMDDEEGYRLAAIEHFNKDTGEATKGRVFYENAIKLDSTPTINSAEDALLYSLNRVGRPDIRLMADMVGMSQSAVLEAVGDRMFEVPGKPGVYETSEMYLSGNVREKLALAREQAQRDPAFSKNVRALEAVQPAPLTPSEIAANLGMPWIPTKVIEQFATEKLGLQSAKVSYLPKLAQWTAAGDSYSAAAKTTWGTNRIDAMALIEAALNRQTPQVFDRTEDGKRMLNTVDTQAAQDKLAEIKAAFKEWVWSDASRSAALVDQYNQQYNSLVAPKFDGSYLSTPGIASGWEWRPHQSAAIARIIQTGNTYLAHEVGAGKTSEMIGAGMEMKRLGLISKPMYVVPNHMLGQFTKEFYEQYPLARIRVADEQRFHTSRRKEFIARVAADDLDAIIITHSAFNFIPMSDEFTASMISDQINDLVDVLSEVDKSERATRRKIEQQKEQLEQRLSGLTNKKRDQVFTFEEMGVDFLFVDEAHLFRKLDFSTKMGNVKGIDPAGSQMSFDLYAKTRFLESKRPGRNLVMASGTPITNTMAELFSVSRYLQQDELSKRGLGHFDAWAGAFGDTVTSLEQDPAGGYKPVTRFAQFVNVPELSVMVRQVMDVIGAAELRRYVSLPNLKNGSRQMVLAEQTDRQAEYQEVLRERMIAIQRRSGPPKKGDDILLSVIGDGRKSAIDYRLIDSAAPREEGSKLERMIEEVARRHKEFSRTGFHTPLPGGAGFSEKPVTHGPATQMIFSDFGINGEFPVHKYIRNSLIERGVPAGQIALISDFKSHIAKQRLFNDMNEGKVRVLIGSVAKMGTGVNAQKRLRAVHNMDAQWYPANDTQRNGRIIRQGNMNPEVEILDYSTKGTYDSQMWNLMAKKARFIEGFMRGDPTMRDMEDLGEASQYEQAMAMTTSDPRIMDMTEWKQELEKFQRRRLAHEREQQNIRLRIVRAEQAIKEADRLIPLIEKDIAQRALPSSDEFTGEVRGQQYDDRSEFGMALMSAMDDIVERADGRDLREGVGKFGGFALVAETHPGPDGGHQFFTIKRNGGRDSRVDVGSDSRGLVTRMANALRSFDKELAYEQEDRSSAEGRLAEYRPKLGEKFDDGGKIEELSSRIADMEEVLRKESEKAAAATLPKQSIPEGKPVAVLNGDELGTWSDMLDLQKKARAWYRQNLTFRTVTSSDGQKIQFTRAGEGKMRAGDRIMRAVPAIRAILEQGKHEGPLPPSDKWAARGVVAAHRYTAPVEIDGQTHAFGVLVQEMKDGRRFYVLSDKPDELGAGGRSSLIEGASQHGPKEITPGDINLFVVDQSGNSDVPSDLTDTRSALDARLGKLRLSDKVRLAIVDTLGGQAAGQYRDKLITIATDTAQPAAFTLDHEAIHALRDLGLFNNSEWAILASAARRDPGLMRSIDQRYSALSPDARVEEAVADLFARHQDGRYKAAGTVERVFKLLRQVFEAVRNAFAGRGLRTAEGVMQSVDAGEVGARAQTPALDESEARYSIPEREDMVSLAGAEPSWKDKASDAIDRWRTAVQDRYLPLLKVQRQIEQQTGKELPPSRNPYMGEELMTGRIGARLERLAQDHVEPLFDAMHADNVSIDELESYLYARHAPERNARIAEINPDFTEGEGSGMTDLEAAAIMSRIRKDGKLDAMKRLAARVDAIRDMALNYRVETGLMSQEQADEWRSTYEFYVPLRGFKETGTDPIPARMNRSGGGINVRGRESKSAYGRRSKADSPFAYTIMQAEEAIVRGETNLVAQRFVNLARANPDPGFWKVNKVTERQRMNEDSGLVESYLTRNLLAEDRDWTVSAKFNGKEVRVTMDKGNVDARRLADAMRNLTQHQLDWITLHLGKVNRFLSAVNTSYNPEFIITNAFRDLQTATFNLSGEGVKGVVRGTLRDYRAALVASTKGAFGKHSGEWGRWYDEFVNEGGRIYFNKVENIEEIKKRIAGAAKLATMKAGGGGAMIQGKRALLAIRDMIENLNLGVENAIRLSAFKNAREAGLSPERAASLAKNLTVNFNRRGTAGPAINALYLFANASIQGSARILMAMRSPKVRKMLAATMIASAAVELLNAMVSAIDDDGESIYDKIPEYEKARNIVLMLPGGSTYVKFPLPYGYNVFWGAGRSAAEIARRGGARWKETMANFAGEVADAFNPVGGSQSLLNFIAPTIVDPIVDLEQNKDFSGRKIMPDQPAYGPQEPDSQRYWGSVGPHWRAITDALNEATGGDDVVPGAVDVSPETLEYLAGTAVGSAGGFLDRMASLVSKGFDPDAEVTANDIPLARKVTGSKPAWYDKSAYYDRIGATEQELSYVKKYLEAGNREQAKAYAVSVRPYLLLEPEMKQAKRDMKIVRKARAELNLAEQRGAIDSTSYRMKKARVDAAEKAVVSRFNTAWNTVMQGER
ncbi:N-6 DNA methylase [Novosphingobium sp. NBM11]|uniref:phage tail tip lysozyme n=1 Tax=Novosphingobium sp. NBM11 TaxID=2596914 RepID=UPI001891FB73|nr:phage tail tip lysozyme [Novosphingobium sp. NBM11]MBF5091902.1 N-6 DNA methylase [Novosphingobium sp. NBM11]